MIVAKQDAQGLGSGLSYSRRYSLAAMVGVFQVDDDGEAATGRAPGVGRVGPEQPAPGDGNVDANGNIPETEYRISFGQWKGRGIEEVYRNHGPDKIAKYIDYLEDTAKKKNQAISAPVAEFIDHASSYLGAMENNGSVA